MISLEDLRNIARVKIISNMGYAEKDYLLDLILFSISKNTKDELVFKGGTCLYKIYKINRFSEDIDFSAVKEIDLGNLINKIIIDLRLFGIEATTKEKKERYNTTLIDLHAKGPLYNGNSNSLCNIRIDINTKSEVNFKPVLHRYNSLYSEISEYSLLVMSKEEILAEKIRAIINRDKARDVYDLWFLLENGVKIDKSLIEKKLKYYEKMFDYSEFIKRIKDKKKLWGVEIGRLIMGQVPDFKVVEETIIKKTRGLKYT